MITLRDYQEAAIQAARDDLAKGHKRTLIVAPTGSGKAILSGKIAALAAPNGRVLVLCSQSHLIKQNLEKFNSFCDVEAGIYCNSLNRKDTDHQVIFASRDSLGRNPELCGKFSLVVLDESHQLDTREDSMYMRIMNAQKDAYVVGMTGTPWRLSGGRIWGENKFFQGICYNIGMDVLRQRGFLVPYKFPLVNTKVDTDGIKTQNGDFNLKQLEERTSNESIIKGSIHEWLAHEKLRRCTMFFCVTRNHAQKVCNALYDFLREDEVVYVDGETKDRDKILNDIREGKFKAVVSIGALTTGFDAPIVDCIVMLRATKSTSLFVQICGRGLRPYPGKKDLLILDFAQNFTRFGTLEMPRVTDMQVSSQDSESSMDGEKKTKKCDACKATISLFARECGFCGEIFKMNHSTKAHRVGDKAAIHRCKVLSVSVEPHVKRDTQESGFKVVWRVIADKRMRVLSEYFMVHRKASIKRLYEDRLAQIKAKPLFVTCHIDGVFIKPIDVDTENIAFTRHN